MQNFGSLLEMHSVRSLLSRPRSQIDCSCIGRHVCLTHPCIQRGADALANLPNLGKVVSRKGDAASSATKQVARLSAFSANR